MLRERRGRTSRAEEAASQVVGFMVAGVVFLAAVGGILFMAGSHGGGDPAAPRSVAKQVEADSLADLLVSSPGIGWSDGADHVARLGIQNANGSGVDLGRVDLLRGAMYDADGANGRVDYMEALASLDMPPDTYFHLRMYPVGLETVYEDTLAGTRVAYIGDWLSFAPLVTVTAGTPEGMLVQANAQLNVTMYPSTASERQAIRGLGVVFDDQVNLGASLPNVVMEAGLIDPTLYSLVGAAMAAGDVYPDIKQYLDAVVSTRITVANYDVLVVGSGVDHSSLTSAVTKNAIRDFVHNGGTLMAMGSSAQSTQWLQPLFDVGVKTVNTGPFAPDVSHPLLHEPNDLDWQSYQNFGLGWDIKTQGAGAHHSDFTHVVTAGGKDILAVSNDGAFGSGRIFLTEYRPRDIVSGLGVTEAMNFMGNMFLYAERDHLYLEYGPQVPDGTEVTAVVRQSHAWDAQLGLVPVRLEVHLWHDESEGLAG